jgi:formiminotetrahydrofolate cyclodeaminase
MESLAEKTCRGFIEALYSKDAVPGGGGAAALTGALGAALAGMVANLTTGKKKYAANEEDIQHILVQARALQDRFLAMIDEDAENFAPLAKAYGLPAGTDDEKARKAEVLEACTLTACTVPMEIVRISCEAIALQDELLEKGSLLALSDVGVGAECLRAALVSGWMNVQINIRTLQDRQKAQAIADELMPLVTAGTRQAESISNEVQRRLS